MPQYWIPWLFSVQMHVVICVLPLTMRYVMLARSTWLAWTVWRAKWRLAPNSNQQTNIIKMKYHPSVRRRKNRWKYIACYFRGVYCAEEPIDVDLLEKGSHQITERTSHTAHNTIHMLVFVLLHKIVSTIALYLVLNPKSSCTIYVLCTYNRCRFTAILPIDRCWLLNNNPRGLCVSSMSQFNPASVFGTFSISFGQFHLKSKHLRLAMTSICGGRLFD